MNQLITTEIKMTSLDIAEVTGKRHADVMRDVRKEIDDLGEDFNQRIFALVKYTDKKGEERPCYEFGKKGAMQLALKYDAKTRFRVIERIEELESEQTKTVEQALLNPDTIIKLATSWKEEQVKRIEAENTIEQQQPLVAFAETCMTSDKSLLVRELAKLASKQGIKTGEKRLWQKLREWKLVFANKNEPYQEYVDRGYFEIAQGVKETNKGSFTWLTMRVKPKGQAYIINRLKKEVA